MTDTQLISQDSQDAGLSALDACIDRANRIDDGPTSTHNELLRVAFGFERFVTACIDDMAASQDLNLPLIDLSNGGKGNEFHGGQIKLAGRHDAYGPGLDEVVMRAIKTYTTHVTRDDMRPIMRAVSAYCALAGRVSKIRARNGAAFNARKRDMAKVESAMRASLAQLASLDSKLWHVYTSEKGKQHLSGIAAASLEVDGHAWADGKVCKGQTEGTRRDASAQAFIRNGKSFHSYVAATGSVSERDMARN